MGWYRLPLLKMGGGASRIGVGGSSIMGVGMSMMPSLDGISIYLSRQH